MDKNFPWHNSIWSKLASGVEHIPHGILLSGQSGTGKLQLARRFARLLLCDSPLTVNKDGQEACGNCKSCKLIESGNHPDFIFISPEDSKKVITVDQTRELSRQLQLKSHIAKRKVAIIHPAEAMNKNAANSLLKILEEPPQNNILLLVTNKNSFLSMTIKSRCIKFNAPLPDNQTATRWLQSCQPDKSEPAESIQSLLKLSGGAPLLALELLQNDFSRTRQQLLDDVLTIANEKQNFSACAKKWKETGSELCLMWFQGFLSDLVKITMLDSPGKPANSQTLANKELNTGLQLPKKALNLKQLFDFIDVVSESRRLLNAPMDEQLLLEDVLIRWQGLARA